MTHDFNKPALSDDYADVLTEIRAGYTSTARMNFEADGDTNTPDGAIQFNRTDKLFELLSSGVWGGLHIAGVGQYVVPGGSANALTITSSPAMGAYTAGEVVRFIAQATNTGAVTINRDGLGAKNLRHSLSSGIEILAGQLTLGQACVAMYDGSVYRLLTPSTSVVHAATGTVTIDNSTTETDLLTFTIPAGALKANRSLRVRAFGDFYNITGSSALAQLMVYFDTIKILDTGVQSISTSLNRGLWEVEGVLHTIDDSNQRTSFHVYMPYLGAENDNVTPQDPVHLYGGLTNTTGDLTTSSVIKVTGKMNTASNDFELRLLGGFIEII